MSPLFSKIIEVYLFCLSHYSTSKHLYHICTYDAMVVKYNPPLPLTCSKGRDSFQEVYIKITIILLDVALNQFENSSHHH